MLKENWGYSARKMDMDGEQKYNGSYVCIFIFVHPGQKSRDSSQQNVDNVSAYI